MAERPGPGLSPRPNPEDEGPARSALRTRLWYKPESPIVRLPKWLIGIGIGVGVGGPSLLVFVRFWYDGGSLDRAGARTASRAFLPVDARHLLISTLTLALTLGLELEFDARRILVRVTCIAATSPIADP